MSEETTVSVDEAEAKTQLFNALGVEVEKEETTETTIEEPVVETKEEVEQTEETAEAVTETTSDETQESEYTEVEQEAMKLGWKPEGVPGKKAKSAEDWMDDYSLYKKINDLGKQVQEKNSLLENVAKHFESVQEASYNQAKKEFDKQVEDLRKLAAQTIEAGEYAPEDVISAYENDLKTMKTEHEEAISKFKKEEPQNVQQSAKEEVLSNLSESEKQFVNKYEKTLFSQKPDDIAVQAYVVNRNNELAQEDLSAEARMTTLEKELASVFPTKFGTVKKIKPVTTPKVESASVTGKPQKGFSLKNLAPDQKELYNYFVEQGVDKDELLAQFKLVIDQDK
jgi:hypothetical protein